MQIKSVNLLLELEERRRFIAPGMLCVTISQLQNNNIT